MNSCLEEPPYFSFLHRVVNNPQDYALKKPTDRFHQPLSKGPGL